MKVRGRRPDLDVGPGERVLAWAPTGSGVLAGTRDALYLPVPPDAGAGDPRVHRVPWEQVESADWDAEQSVLRVREVATWGERRPEHLVPLDAPVRMLQLVRERVSASVVVQRHVPVSGRRGLRVIARRAPSGDRPMTWLFEYDEGVEPDDPLVREAAETALAAAMEDVGPT